MADIDTIIRGGTVVSTEGRATQDIAIRDGRIVSVGAGLDLPARETIDASGLYVLPGVIDCHVHLRDPGETDREDWATGTAAAACGGVTTVFDMPNTYPPVDTVENLRIKHEIASARAHVDFGLYGVLAANNLDHLEALSRHGVVGFKCFMSGSIGGNLAPPDDGAMLDGFGTIARLGKRCVVHAENAAIIARRERQLKAEGRTDPMAHTDCRPPVAAAEATARAIVFAEWTGMRLHIAHETSANSLPLLAAARARGMDLTVETCPQYLLLNADDWASQGGAMKCNPPIREAGHDAALWEALRSGIIDVLSSDHAPLLPEEKAKASIWDVAPGLNGVETAVPLLLTEVNKGRLTLERFVALTSAGPAKVWDLQPRKGLIAPGYDADIILVDMDREAVIDQAALHSKSRISPWHGWHVKGLPVRTIVRGRTVMLDGHVTGDPGWGRSVEQLVPAAALKPPDPCSPRPQVQKATA